MYKAKEKSKFFELRRQHLDAKKFFKDPDFKPGDGILQCKHRQVDWLRPREFCTNPQFVVNGFSRFDVRQGSIGDCWFLAALATLTQSPKLLEKVVPLDNDFDSNYAGIFHFRFWKNGEWVEIVIDDRLPVSGGKLIFMKAPHSEFWGPLVEKAYAKLYGSYGAIEGGYITEAMVDFTGGVFERYNLKAAPAKLYKIIENANKRGSLIGASICSAYVEGIRKAGKGLIDGHAYSVTKAWTISENASGRPIQVLRVKNPWNNAVEWNGPFGDKSTEWNSVPENIKKDMKVSFDDDGEFYITMSDFLKFFDQIEICHVSPDDLCDDNREKKWIQSSYAGSWNKRDSTQVIVQLTDPDEDDEEYNCSMIVALMQKNRREEKKNNKAISFDVYQLVNNDLKTPHLDEEFLRRRKLPSGHKPEAYREICSRFTFLPGFYAIVPRIGSYGGGEYLLRIFTEAPKLGPPKNSVIIKVNNKELVEPAPVNAEVRLQIIDVAAAPISRPRSNRSICTNIKVFTVSLLLTGLLIVAMIFVAFSINKYF